MALDYRGFVDEVESRLSSRFSEDISIEVREVIKNNDSRLDGLIIKRKGDMVSPTLYLAAFFEDYENGASLDEVCDGIVETYEESRMELDLDPDIFSDFKLIRDRIIYRLVNADKNTVLLSDVPHIPYLDLAIVFCISLSVEADVTATILIHESHLAMWKVGVRELMRCAGENTPRLFPYRYFNMESFIEGRLERATDKPIEVLSNRSRVYGATALLYPDALKSRAAEAGGDLYILPSSVHELILMPVRDGMDIDHLNRVIGEVNSSAVAHEDVLSDHAYIYSAQTGRITSCA